MIITSDNAEESNRSHFFFFYLLAIYIFKTFEVYMSYLR